MLVSAHPGARIQQPGQPYLAGHENWQGKVYKIHGSEPDCPNLLEMTGYNIDEHGSGKVVNPLGLHGYNCRHSHTPWDKSLRNPYLDENGKPTVDTEESRKIYESQQKQRAMERAIRKTKRELLMKQKEIDSIAEVDVKEIIQRNYDRLAYKLRRQNAVYNEFCEKNGLQKQSDRLKVASFKRAQASKTTGRARAYEYWNNEDVTSVENFQSKEKRGTNKLRGLLGKNSGIIKKFEIGLSELNNKDVKTLLRQAKERVNFVKADKRGSHYETSTHTIRYGTAATPGTLAHELFHEVYDTYRLEEDEFLSRSIKNDYNKLINFAKGYGKSVEEMLYLRYPKALYINEKGKIVMHEKYRGLSDIIHGASGGTIYLGYGHSKPGYWSRYKMVEKEAFAQFGRMLYDQDDEVLEMLSEVFGETYKEVIERLGGMIK